MSAAKHNISIEAGADFYEKFTLRDTIGALVDLTHCTFTSKLKRNISDASAVLTFTINVLNQVTNKGEFERVLTPVQTSGIPLDAQNFADRVPEDFCHDIYMTDGDGFVTRLVEGVAYVSPSVST